MKDFKAFLLRGNLVDMAVGIVIGIAFGAVITAFVADLVTPLIAAIFGKPGFCEPDLHDQQQPVQLRRVPERAGRIRPRRDRALLPRDQAGERAGRALSSGAAGRPDHAQLPRVPERDTGRRDALRVLHDRARHRQPREAGAGGGSPPPPATSASKRRMSSPASGCQRTPTVKRRPSYFERLDATVGVAGDRPETRTQRRESLMVVGAGSRPVRRAPTRAACPARVSTPCSEKLPGVSLWPLWPTTSGRCWTRSPPSATLSTCEPRQMASTGRSRSIAAVSSASSAPSRSGTTPSSRRAAPGRRARGRGRSPPRRSGRRARRGSRRPRRRAAGRAADGRRRGRRRGRSRSERAPRSAPRPRRTPG